MLDTVNTAVQMSQQSSDALNIAVQLLNLKVQFFVTWNQNKYWPFVSKTLVNTDTNTDNNTRHCDIHKLLYIDSDDMVEPLILAARNFSV